MDDEMKPRRKGGRPSIYSDEIAEEYFRRLADGETELDICEDEHMPTRQTFRDWKLKREGFLALCTRARAAQADHEHDTTVRIENDVLAGKIPPDAARVVLNSKQWRMMRLSPKSYGDKTAVEHSGALTLEQLITQSYEKKKDGE